MSGNNENIDYGGLAPGKYCNVCGNQLSKCEEDDNITIQVVLGYGSARDEQEHSVTFCHKCFDKLIGSCKRPTLIKDYFERIDEDE